MELALGGSLFQKELCSRGGTLPMELALGVELFPLGRSVVPISRISSIFHFDQKKKEKKRKNQNLLKIVLSSIPTLPSKQHRITSNNKQICVLNSINANNNGYKVPPGICFLSPIVGPRAPLDDCRAACLLRRYSCPHFGLALTCKCWLSSSSWVGDNSRHYIVVC
jgi:hypothetical protein